MALYKIKDIYANPAEKYFDGHDITSFDVYALEDGEYQRAGSVNNLLLDESGRFRYFVVSTGLWILGKTILLPVGYVKVDYDNQRLYTARLTKDQVEALPEYNGDMVVDEPYENTVYNTYRRDSVGRSGAGKQTVPVGAGTTEPTSSHQYSGNAANAESRYTKSPETYNVPKDDDRIRLYEERLVADKRREKTGDVKISKSVETTTQQVSVPVQKEKVVVEVSQPTTATAASAGATNFKETEMVNMELHQDVATARKDVQLRETIKVRKEVEQDTETFKKKVRREELDVDSANSANVEMRKS